jgi:hypothetical protein
MGMALCHGWARGRASWRKRLVMCFFLYPSGLGPRISFLRPAKTSALRNEKFQYDFGKTVQGQSFCSTGSLNQPPTILRAAVSGLRAQYEMNGHQLEEAIGGILQRKKECDESTSGQTQIVTGYIGAKSFILQTTKQVAREVAVMIRQNWSYGVSGLRTKITLQSTMARSRRETS